MSPNIRSRRDVIALAAAGAMLAAGAPATAAISYKRPTDWDRLVDAAKQEGTLVLYGPAGDSLYEALITRFNRVYPEIKVKSTLGVGAPLLAKLAAERAAGLHLADVWVNGSTAVLKDLKPEHGLQPLDPWLLLPEIREPKAWMQNMLWYNDGEAPNTNLSFAAIKYPIGYVNTQLCKLSQIRSYWDLVDPKWKGKVCSTDIRIIGTGGVQASYIYKTPSLGLKWFQEFFGSLDVTLARDQRQLVDGLARGRYAIAGFISAEEASKAIDQGLPIAAIDLDNLKEGGALAPGGGAVSVIADAPHPNAAKVYVNWLLSRDGQIAWQEETKYASLRTDIPKTGLIAELTPRPGKTYANGGSEAYGGVLTPLATQLTEILQKAGKA